MSLIPPHRPTRAWVVRAFLIFSLFLTAQFLLPERLLNLLRPGAQAASTFTVNSLADTPDAVTGNGICADSAGNCTLRAAIQEANGFAGDDRIVVSVTGTINLTGALPDIASNITINGPGSSHLTVRRDTGGDYRIFTALNRIVNISGITITNGKTPDGAPNANSTGGFGGYGGGIWHSGGALTLTDVVITGNRTGNGGTSGGSSTGGWGGEGGGIYCFGTLTMTNVVLSNNTTGNGATGYSGGSGGSGGGISYNGPTLTMTNVIITGNTNGSGGISTSGAMGGHGGYGGGIYATGNANLNLTNVTISGNTAGDGDDGGWGGGLYTIPTVTTTMKDCSISNNSSGLGGSKFASQGGLGGGIANFGTMTMTGCAVNDNATKGRLDLSKTESDGGGIYNGNTLTMTNCTVSGNRAYTDGGRGGGIYNTANALTLTNVTITNNSAYTCCGFQSGQGVHNSGVAIVRNTIIAGNGTGTTPDVTGNYNSQGHNIIGKATAGNSGGSNNDQSGFTNGVIGDQVGSPAGPLDAKLGLLASNGGPTQTHALLAGSPALDMGDNALAKDSNNNALTTDQRGAGRIADSTGSGLTPVVDIGAFEFNPSLENVTDKTVSEDTGLLVSFALGDGPETITSVTASSNNQTLVPDANLSITGTGSTRTLKVTPAANQFGTAQITLTVTKSSGPVLIDTFLLTVTAVNDAPTFTPGGSQTVNEDAGAQVVANWATGISAGPNESGQTLTFQVTGNTNAALFSAGPTISDTGTLTYTPAPNAYGSAVVTIVLKDDGGTANGGLDTSTAQTFTITINAVNEAPTFTKGADQTVNEDSGFQSVPNWATGINAGPNESGQSLTFLVTGNTNTALFAFGPSINSAGGLSYTPASNANGTAVITVALKDNGGTANGGQDTSATQTFTINVTAINDAPVNQLPFSPTTNQNAPLVFSTATFNAISVIDVDAGSDQLRITLTATNGTLTLSTTNGLTFITGDGSDDATMSFTGTLGSLNSALNGLTFKPNAGFNGSASIQISTEDQGHNGSGGAQTDTDSISITVRAGGVLQFTIASYQVIEDNVSATITVARTGGNGGATSINYASSNGTANGGASCAQGVDYLNASGTLSWPNNDASPKSFTITICPDSLNEQDETINIAISNPIGSASLGTRTAATLTIINDDSPTVQLSQSAYTIGEAGGSLAVPVTRTDAATAATVDYATSDIAGLTPCNTFNGIASSRCDYATTIGRLQFAAGEASKTIFIPVVDDAWADGTESFALTLSNPSGAALGGNTAATITITDNDINSNASNPIDQNPFFVRQQYIDFLGREPDAAGLQGWQDVLNNCGTTIQQPCDKIEVSAGFFRSKEFQERGYFIYKFYSAVGRIPLYPEFMPDLAKVSGFLSDQQLEANKNAFVQEFMARPDYQTRYGAITDPTAYVDALLNTVGLPNHPSRGGWIAGLTNGSLTKAKVFRELTESSEMQQKYNTEAFVIMQYFGYLRRSADASYLAWIDIMNQNPTNYRGMIDGFINSDEYRKRFGQ